MSKIKHQSLGGALVKQPIRLIAIHRGQKLMDQVFQHTPIRVGRLLDNDVILPFDFVSRYHCELRFENDQWTAIDLGSKNGLLLAGQNRVNELQLEDGIDFRIQELTLHFKFEQAVEVAGDFTAIREDITHAGEEISVVGHIEGEHRPLMDIDVKTLLFTPHETVMQAKEKALQLSVVWQDQVLETREIPIGAPLRLEFLGETFRLGTVKSNSTPVKLPKGASPLEDHAGQPLIITHDSPVTFRMRDHVLVTVRYVPKSKELARSTEWVEDRLVDPLLASGAVHGAAAVAVLFMAPKKHPPIVREEPDRFATIMVKPTPQQIAMIEATPTPTPTPEATPAPTPLPPEPTPQPKKIAKPEPTPPPEKLKKVVSMKKMKRPAIRKREDPGTQHKEEPKVAKVMETPPPEQPKEMPPVVMNEPEPPAPPAPPEPPAPTPQPFNAKSVGALKMLSNLSVGPASDVANVEKIQISRAPANATGSMIGREAVEGTGDMITKISQSAKGGGTGKGNGATGVAVGGKSAGGQYKMAGLAGKAGSRKVRGSVLGGATYSELTKNEGLTREQVMKVVQKHQAEIQSCYERSLMQNPDLVGRADFEWEITPKGSVTFVNVKETTLKNGEALLTCVKGVFAGMKFPEAKNGEATTPTIGLPFGRL